MLRIIIPRNPNEPNSEKSKGSGSTTSIFEKMTAKLRWEQKHIAPELGEELYPYYKHYCYIFLNGYRYEGPGYGNYRENCDDRYDEVGNRLAQMWSKDEETEDRKVNHYCRS